MLTKVRQKLGQWLLPGVAEMSVDLVRAHPIQRRDKMDFLFAETVNLQPIMVQYALNHWVYTAINKIATLAATAEFLVTSRPDGMKQSTDHRLLDLIGKYGRPNDAQDSFEFWEKHYQYLGIAGNSYWLWQSRFGGEPDEVHLLEPQHMRIKPGSDKTVEKYVYWNRGEEIPFDPVEVTHFRRANPFNRYYGLSALQVLYWVVLSDNNMLSWNNAFFDDELGLPAGIMVVPSDTPDAEIERIRSEFTARHGEGRRVAIVKSDLGKAVWQDGGLKHKDYDFLLGRTLNRKAVFEALDLPLGVMSEESTEAHAIVSERRLMETVRVRHIRTARRLNIDVLPFWAAARGWQADFEDVTRRATDWRREKDRLASDAMALSLDEMRMREHRLSALPAGVLTVAELLKPGKGNENGKQIRDEEGV